MKHLFTHLRLTVALLIASLLAPAFAQPVQAAKETGYLWTLTFDFEAGYNGELLLKVGPWQNGALLDVTEKSVTAVNCQPVGDVSLGKGYATFNNGGYLQCNLDIAGALLANHGIKANEIDTYGSLTIRARTSVVGNGTAPLFAHPDAQFWLTTPSAMQVTVNSDLSNGNGAMTSWFSAVSWNSWQTYTSYYLCGGGCDLTHYAGANQQTLANQGTAATFATAPTHFTIGKLGGNTLTGRIDELIIDPGNSGHY